MQNVNILADYSLYNYLMKKIIIFILTLFTFSTAFAMEKINSFDVNLTVNGDGSAIVTENITVTAEHNKIKRGIYRDMPNTPKNPITPISLNMDGAPHPYFTENANNALRVNFGNNDYISAGVHTYVFKYKMDRAVRQFKNYDEIYWNVTGNYWRFQIDKASFTVNLPQGASPVEDKISLYTGRYGASGVAEAKQTSPLHFETVTALYPAEGFTVAVPFSKGFVTMPPLPISLRPEIIVPLVLLLTFLYCFAAWYIAGRDPQSRVVRQYAPPKDISPAVARYLSNMYFDNKTLSVIIISMTLKGVVTISQKPSLYEYFGGKDKDSVLGKVFGGKGDFVISLKKRPSELKGILSPEEQVVYDSFFNSRKVVVIGGENRTLLIKTLDKAKKTVETNVGKAYFKRNLIWITPLLLPFAYIGYKVSGNSDAAVVTGFAFVFILMFMVSIVRTIKSKHIFAFIPAALVIIVFIPFVLTFKGLIGKTAFSPEVFWYCGGLVAIIAGMLIFYKLIKKYSPEGRAVMDEIDGFKEYLLTAEEYRAKATDPTDQQKIFCDYFPYAVALDAENKWVSYFEGALGESTVRESMGARGIASTAFVTGSGLGALSSGLSSSISASTSSNGSGGGGGGFSGGGSGGGGGGGR